MEIKTKSEFVIFNESNIILPDSLNSDLQEICRIASISVDKVALTIKHRNKRYNGTYPRAPCGSYCCDGKTVIVRIVPNMNYEDFLYILAHEIGHLKQALELNNIRLSGVYDREFYASDFAVNKCNCYPSKESRYRGMNIIKEASGIP